MKVSQKAKLGRSIFQLKIKRKQFQIRRHFQHLKYDMNKTKVFCNPNFDYILKNAAAIIKIYQKKS